MVLSSLGENSDMFELFFYLMLWNQSLNDTAHLWILILLTGYFDHRDTSQFLSC